MGIDPKKISALVGPQGDVVVPGTVGGGKGPMTFPPDHVAAMRVPKGGSSCSNCEYVDAANHQCTSPNYVRWNGGDPKLPPLALDEMCSDWYESAEPLGDE